MPRWLADSAEALRAAERWLLPGQCLLCQERVGRGIEDALVCALCRSRWVRLPFPQCPRCGQPTDADTECRVCREWPPELAGVASSVWMEPSARKAVHLLKYEGWHRITDSMAVPMATLPPVAAGGLLIPIPLGAARLQTRGYNQSAGLARSVGRLAGIPVAETALVRVRDTRTQTTLTPEEREANLRDAFRVAGSVPARVVLVDDVFTTGATLVSAARALLEGGARAVTAVTFARAELPLAAISRIDSH